jgi:hypothetical protein
MAGRPPLRMGQHGKITRTYLGGGVWLARARFRDPDGVTRIVERRAPADEQDAHGKLAEDALVDALNQRRTAGDSEITLDSRIIALVDQHIDRLQEDGRAVRTIDTCRYCAKLREDHRWRSCWGSDTSSPRRCHSVDASGSW